MCPSMIPNLERFIAAQIQFGDFESAEEVVLAEVPPNLRQRRFGYFQSNDYTELSDHANWRGI